MINCVLDTSSLVAYLREEQGWETVGERLRFRGCIMHAVNVGEFLFTAPKRMPERFTPESALAWFNGAEIGVSNLLDFRFLQQTARIRLTERSLSIGDGMAVALASSLDVPVLTTEYGFLRAAEYARIEIIRPLADRRARKKRP